MNRALARHRHDLVRHPLQLARSAGQEGDIGSRLHPLDGARGTS